MTQELFSLMWLVVDRVATARFDSESETWSIGFASGSTLRIDCMWRLLEDGVIACTSFDHKHQFGLPKPFDGEAALLEMSQYLVSGVHLREGTSDLSVSFEEDFVLEVVPTSAGYESWSASHPHLGRVICASGGELHAMRA